MPFRSLVDNWLDDFKDEYKGIESDIKFYAEKTATPAMQVPVEIQDNLINAIYACHDGVVRMIPSYPDVVETSSNLAIIDIEGGHAFIKILARSSREDMKDYVVKMLESLFQHGGHEGGDSRLVWRMGPQPGVSHPALAAERV